MRIGTGILLAGVTMLSSAALAQQRAPERYAIGDEVELRSLGKWYHATIVKSLGGDAYILRFDGGDEAMERESGNLRLLRRATPVAALATTAPTPALRDPQRDRIRWADGTGVGGPEGLGDSDLGTRATYRFTEYPERACPAAAEYLRRGVADSRAVAIRETIAPFCRKRAVRVAPSPSGAVPPPGRYVCMRLASSGNTITGDLRLQPGGGYSFAGDAGRYRIADGLMTFVGGPFATTTTHWVGQFHPPGPRFALPTIALRTQADVAAGNARDLQWCNLAD
ncbi:hypothetical protein M9979_11265 [Sphingomonas sp. RP10(2022)]|uniref:Agenet-like domain-containing protein n=1 Tax=Sphingomonas liriopis TaxID=2949094 RepID=A0A9X2KU08_9SPHN|nr:hypothetical protein [Sphingomonas liriopis]MCP3735448.1 hypothetical protein [Sphingomonas liriopis]